MVGVGGLLGIILAVVSSLLIFYKYSFRTSKLIYISIIFYTIGYFVSAFFLQYEQSGFLENITFNYKSLSEVYLISGVYIFIAVSVYLATDFRSRNSEHHFNDDKTIRFLARMQVPILIILYWGVYTGQINSIRMFLGVESKITFIVTIAMLLWPVTLLAYLVTIKKFTSVVILLQMGVSIAAGNRREIISIIVLLLIVNYFFDKKKLHLRSVILLLIPIILLGVYATAVQEELVKAIYRSGDFSLREVLLPALKVVFNDFSAQLAKLAFAFFAWQEQTYLIDASLNVLNKTGCSGITELPRMLLPFSNTLGFSGECRNEEILFHHALLKASGDPYLIIPFIPDIIIGHGVEWLPLFTAINILIYKITEYYCLKVSRSRLVSFIYFAYFWPLTQSITQSFLNQVYVAFIKVLILVLVLSTLANFLRLMVPTKTKKHRW